MRADKDIGLEDNVKGFVPLNLDEMQGLGTVSNTDYEIDEVLGDIIMAEFIDQNDQGEVNRGGIWIKEDIGTKMWRTAKVVKIGSQVKPPVTVGCFIRFPSDRGIRMVGMEGTRFIFLNAERVFCTVTPKK